MAEERDGQNGCLLTHILLNALVFVGLIVVNYFAGNPQASGGLFIHGIGNVSEIYNLSITPAGATFAIWGVIYIWQLVWVLYTITSICRDTRDGPAYTSPVLLPVGFFLVYIVNMGSNILWLFLWDREYIKLALPTLAITAITLYVCIGISYKYLSDNLMYLYENNRGSEVSWMRFGVQNGLAMYGTWVSVATILNLGAVLVYKLDTPIPDPDASMICLGILSGLIAVFVSLDLSILDVYSRYVFMPYVVLVIALGGSIAKNWNPEETNSIISAVMLGVVAAFLVLKVALILRRREKNRYEMLKSKRDRSLFI